MVNPVGSFADRLFPVDVQWNNKQVAPDESSFQF